MEQSFADFAMLHDGSGGAEKQGLMASFAMRRINADNDPLRAAELPHSSDKFLAVHRREYIGQNCPIVKLRRGAA